MTCICDRNKNKAIIIVRGNDTDFNDANFLTINLITTILDLSTFKATFKLGSIIKQFNDISSGVININFTKTETAKLLPFCYGTLILTDTSNKVATIESKIPFKVISDVSGKAIATEPYTLNFDVKQGNETILNVNIESAVSVEVGQTTTLPAGSQATVTNSGTGNHLILNFGIPKGQDGLTPTWGNIGGNIQDQTDLQNELNSISGGLSDSITALDSVVSSNYNTLDGKIDSINGALSDSISAIDSTIGGYGNIVTHNVSEFATAAQGALADSAIQSITTGSTNGTIAVDGTDVSVYGLGSAAYTASTAYATSIQGGLADTAVQPNDNLSVLTDNSATYPIDKAKTLDGLTATITELNYADGVTSAIQTQFNSITEKIPSAATSSNQLTDKNFVNSSIATNTAYFIGTFNSVADLEAYSGTLTNNDYAFVVTTDSLGNTAYDRYKYTTATTPASWQFEYELNNSSFTSDQWAAINSGITSATKVTHTASTAIGSSTQPVYIASDGSATAIGYTIEKSIPSNAAFTDTSAIWGNITGTLSNQTDLQNALDAKQDVLNAGSGISISTGGSVIPLTQALPYTFNSTRANTNFVSSANFDTTKERVVILEVPIDVAYVTFYLNGVDARYGIVVKNTGLSDIYVSDGSYSSEYNTTSFPVSGSHNYLKFVIDTDNKTDIYYGYDNSTWTLLLSKSRSNQRDDTWTNGVNICNDETTGWTLSYMSVAYGGVSNAISCDNTIARLTDIKNATLTIQKNGSTVDTFTANASSDKTINITVPTDTGDLTNNAGFITSSAITNMQTTANLVTSVSSSSTDSQYPSAKLFYDTCGDIATLINAL